MILQVCGQRGSYAGLDEVPAGRLESRKIYFCVISGVNDDGEPTQEVEICKVVNSNEKLESCTMKYDAKIAGQTIETQVKREAGPVKQVWFLNRVGINADGNGFKLSQLPNCRFFGPIRVEVEGT